MGLILRLEVFPVVEVVPFDSITFGDNRSFDDHRTYFGIYGSDEWNPNPRVAISGGARLDHTSEHLEAEFEELGGGPGEGVEGVTTDDRSDTKLSGDAGVMFRLLSPSSPKDNQANPYFSFKSTFKPAAPNLSEAESAQILKPERANSIEGGVKVRTMEQQMWFDVSLFHMDFENLVVSVLGPDNLPALTNAGKERFTGIELNAEYHPIQIPNTVFRIGYAHHNPKFVDFTFFTPDGEPVTVDGNFLELGAKKPV